jgi:hypothetical protein
MNATNDQSIRGKLPSSELAFNSAISVEYFVTGQKMSEILGLTPTSNPLGGIPAWNLCGGICVGHDLLQGTSSRLGGDSYEGLICFATSPQPNLKALPTVLLSVNE